MWSHKIVEEAEIEGTRICTPVFSTCETSKFQLTVHSQRAQISTDESNANDRSIVDAAINIVDALPETPYKAIGINFHVDFHPDEGDTADELVKRFRDMFSNLSSPIFSDDSSGETISGLFLVRPSVGGYLKLLVSPMFTDGEYSNGVNYFNANYNYHFRVKGDGEELVKATHDALDRYEEALAETNRLNETLEKS